MTDTFIDRNFGGSNFLDDLSDIKQMVIRPEDMSIVRLDMMVNHEPADIDGENDIHLSTGTGFLVSNMDGKKSLVTSWHNFTGLHHETRDWLSTKTKCSPTHVRVKNCYKTQNDSGFHLNRIPLYIDSGPKWLVHPRRRNYYDIACLKMEQNDTLGYRYPPIDLSEQSLRGSTRTATDIFIVGYATNDLANQFLPIWKKGNIASSPQIPVGGHPKFLGDAATRSGMSGSPVFIQDKNCLMKFGEGHNSYHDLDGPMKFLGIYSGRISSINNAGSSDLGFIWWDNIVNEVAFEGVLDCFPEHGTPLPTLSWDLASHWSKIPKPY